MSNAINKNAFAAAVRKVTMATTQAPTTDCQFIAIVARDAMNRLGIEPRLLAGYAAWRVDGHDAGAVVANHPSINNKRYCSNIENGFAGHVWLEHDNHIIDFTTFQLPFKIKQLDSIDGKRTSITWRPDYLWFPKKELISLRNVINGYQPGAYYEKDYSLMRRLSAKPPEFDNQIIDLVLRAYESESTGCPMVITGQSSEFYQKVA